MDVLTKESKI